MRARLRSSSRALAWLVVSQHLPCAASRCVDSFNWGCRHLARATDVDHWRGNGAFGSFGSISFFPISRTLWCAIDLAMRPLDYDDGVAPGFILSEDQERLEVERSASHEDDK